MSSKNGSRRVLPFLLCALATAWLPSIARGQHIANHLVISEVAYDTVAEGAGSPSAEFVEIFNPTGAEVNLNDGAVPGTANGLGSYFFSDEQLRYYQVVSGPVAGMNTTDGVWQFPAGVTIPPFGIMVICSDSGVFLNEFFGASDAVSHFRSLPGQPQLLETSQDGPGDGVQDMIWRGGPTARYLNLTNGGEPAILYHWDGSSDLVDDVDIVDWLNNTLVVNKTGVAWDGPDADASTTTFHADLAQTTSLGPATAINVASIQRRNLDETGESEAAGNGVGGHDETSEFWSAASASWTTANDTPGLPLIAVDGRLTDALSWFAPVAVSSADGPNGSASPNDYGAEGTLTELYLASVDLDRDRAIDSLYVAVRGSLFGDPNGSANANFVLVDLDPASTSGARTIGTAGNQLNDETGALDFRLTHLGATLGAAMDGRLGFDAALGLDQYNPADLDTAGWRSWGSGGTAGAIDNFAWDGVLADVQFDPDVDALYSGAAGTSYAASEGFEARMTAAMLGLGALPEYLFVVAMTTSDAPGSASPNTLPESAGDDLGAFPQPLDRGVCFNTRTSQVVVYFVDADGDGAGGSVRSSYCGPLVSGVTTTSSDCDDSDGARYPGNPEICDGKDNDCNGSTDEGVTATYYRDADGDGYGNLVVTTQACSAPAGYLADSTDCDDTRAAVHPGANEVCNGLDDNCIGGVDEGLPVVTFYQDADGDGFGNLAVSTQSCSAPAGYVANSADCNDGNNAVHPGASEVCDDGVDNDCDSLRDECLSSEYCGASHLCAAKLADGESCTARSMCQNNQCVDARCCNVSCGGQCEACDVVGHVGTCWPVIGDPHASRQACAGTSPCTGNCDGTSRTACHYPAGETSCRTASCASDEAIAAAACNGAGACPAEDRVDCLPYHCSGDICGGDCTDDQHCADGNFCRSGICTQKYDLGHDCSGDNQCQLGACVDDVCCAGDCTDQCAACNVANHLGNCWPVSGAPVAGKAPCSGTAPCQGVCDGVSSAACHFPATETGCTIASCSNGQQSAAASCDGTGGCATPAVSSCGHYLCGTDTCLTSCDDGNDCVSNYLCLVNSCAAPPPDAGVLDAATAADRPAATDAARDASQPVDSAGHDLAVVHDAASDAWAGPDSGRDASMRDTTGVTDALIADAAADATATDLAGAGQLAGGAGCACAARAADATPRHVGVLLALIGLLLWRRRRCRHL